MKPKTRFRRPIEAALVLAIAIAGVAVGLVLARLHASRDILGSSTVEFVPGATAGPERQPGIPWPTFGFNNEHTRFGPGQFRPPFRVAWSYRAGTLVEFPPVIGHGRLYFANNSGVLAALETRTGKVIWKHASGRCQASSPALSGRFVFVSYLNRSPCKDKSGRKLDGIVAAYSADSGKPRWRTRIGPSESSPVVDRGRVFVGDWTGKVYALEQKNGRILWSFQTGDAVKGAVAVSGNRLYVGSYDGHVYALNATNGRLIWRASAQARLGPTGTFYSTPTVGYGRVYIGSTDGKVYSFGATSGDLIWAQSTGGYVYSSPAIWNGRVFAGSYSGSFFSFDAATGREIWRFKANGPISGSPTVINRAVYFSTLAQRTYALDSRSGRPIWTFPDGKYTPAVSDGARLYLVGYSRVYALDER